MVVSFATGAAASPFGFNTATTTPTEMYYYPFVEASDAEKRSWYGFRDKDGTLVDGTVTDYLQTLTREANIDTVTIELDDDAGSPFEGHIRLMFTLAAVD
jgi:hypothetical protein